MNYIDSFIYFFKERFDFYYGGIFEIANSTTML